MRKYLALGLIYLLSGCTVAVPVHEAFSPETLGPWGFRIGQVAGSAPYFLTKQASSTVTNVAAPGPIAGWHFGVGLSDNLEVDLEAVGGALSVGMSGALKYQMSGANYFAAKAGNFSSAVTLRAWNAKAPDYKISDSTSSAAYYSGEISADGYDLGVSVGKRMNDWFGAYVGLKGLTGKVQAGYRSTANGPIVTTESRNISGGGLFGAIYISPHGNNVGFDLTLQADLMYLPSLVSDEKTWYNTYLVGIAIPFRF